MCKYENILTQNASLRLKKSEILGYWHHIDAGKTTTTERMLFYSGTIRSMGEVHHGNTVTDYMEQERQRGITITSAAVSFPWHGAQINLIDTPGHIDFTMEVEQSLAVLDGAVIVLDASAGVEAQTLTVWRQASGYRVPRILYLNKMDRPDADVNACIASIRDKLQATPLLLHFPVTKEGKLIGIVDLVTREEIIWTQGRGQNYTRRALSEKEDGRHWDTAMSGHRQLIDELSSLDDRLADAIIQRESLDNMDSAEIESAIRRCALNMTGFPVLCGSSYRNIGVQTLMDSIVAYLPSPLECSGVFRSFGPELAARAFKVQHDDQRGVLTFLRLYSGEIEKGQKVYNLARDRSEQTGSLYVALADEYRLVDKVSAGNIAVVAALKATMSGDLVTSTQSSAKRAKAQLASWLREPGQLEHLMLPSARQRLQALESEPSPEETAEILLGIGATVPEPVFLCSIEPPSAAYQNALETALAELQREDPSLRVSTDEETGQLVLAGMGELHLEVLKERVVREYGIEAELGPLQIAYRETLLGPARAPFQLERRIGGARQAVRLELSARPAALRPRDDPLRPLFPHAPAISSRPWLRPLFLHAPAISSRPWLRPLFPHAPAISSRPWLRPLFLHAPAISSRPWLRPLFPHAPAISSRPWLRPLFLHAPAISSRPWLRPLFPHAPRDLVTALAETTLPPTPPRSRHGPG
ncbi:unnamed protein product, partial [Iphiclides podalirius]